MGIEEKNGRANQQAPERIQQILDRVSRRKHGERVVLTGRERKLERKRRLEEITEKNSSLLEELLSDQK